MPRGGGVAIVVSTLVALPIFAVLGLLSWRGVLAVGLGGALVAAIGFVDDRGHVAPRWRLVGHFIAAAAALALLGGVPPLGAIGLTSTGQGIWVAAGGLYLVWMLNLTNFMDGIDGIAGVEVVTTCLSAGVLGWLSAPDALLWVVPSIVAAATLGFLRWNWPPAKIFMGDSGSGFLGFTLGVMSLQAGWSVGRLFWTWLILLGVFIVDATVTLIRRLAKGDRVFEAHRSHAYQHAAIRARAHLPVTLAVAAINLCWLTPLAALVARRRLDGGVGVAIAYVPLVIAAVRLKAGRPAAARAIAP